MKSNVLFKISLLFLLVLSVGLILYFLLKPEANSNEPEPNPQEFKPVVTQVVGDLDHPWDLRVINTESDILFTQRTKGLFKYSPTTSTTKLIYNPEDLYARGEGGMMGLELSANFDENNAVFVCFNREVESGVEIVVAKVTLDSELSVVIDRDNLVEKIPSNTSGRHSGCRIMRDPSGYLWISTGDAADATNPQDPKGLGGKILRIDENGEPIDGNLGEPFDPRIFSYGHRNSQGITLTMGQNNTIGFGYTSEHGPNKSDEINPLKPGNFGWDPKPPYDESVPMTDSDKYPEAIVALWDSGERTIAISGLQLIQGSIWKDWEGDLLAAALKDSYILKFSVSPIGELSDPQKVVDGMGRIRQVYQAPNGDLYFCTDNGDDKDVIARIRPMQ